MIVIDSLESDDEAMQREIDEFRKKNANTRDPDILIAGYKDILARYGSKVWRKNKADGNGTGSGSGGGSLNETIERGMDQEKKKEDTETEIDEP